MLLSLVFSLPVPQRGPSLIFLQQRYMHNCWSTCGFSFFRRINVRDECRAYAMVQVLVEYYVGLIHTRSSLHASFH